MKRGQFFAAMVCVVVFGLLCAGCAGGRMRPRQIAAPVPSIWPVDNPNSSVSSAFGIRGEGPAARRHNGIDIAASKGAPVLATADGVVTFTGRAGAYGRFVMISHNDGLQTCYAHLRRINVRRGRRVRQGDRIGTIGKSGRATGYHLHYEVRSYGAPINPAPFLPRRTAH